MDSCVRSPCINACWGHQMWWSTSGHCPGPPASGLSGILNASVGLAVVLADKFLAEVLGMSTTGFYLRDEKKFVIRGDPVLDILIFRINRKLVIILFILLSTNLPPTEASRISRFLAPPWTISFLFQSLQCTNRFACPIFSTMQEILAYSTQETYCTLLHKISNCTYFSHAWQFFTLLQELLGVLAYPRILITDVGRPAHPHCSQSQPPYLPLEWRSISLKNKILLWFWLLREKNIKTIKRKGLAYGSSESE